MKKIFTYPVFVVLFISFIGTIGFGSLLRHHYLGGERFQSLQKIAVIIAEVPKNIKLIIELRSFNLSVPPPLDKHKDKKRFEQFIPNQRNALLVLPRFDKSISRSVVDIIDLNNFKIIHTYKHDINEMLNQITNIEEFSRVKIDDAPIRFEYRHPLILDDGSLISDSDYSVEFKIDFCSTLQWINEEEQFHHSKMLDHEDNIWVGGIFNPYPKYIKKYINISDDSLIKLNTDGEILFNKSVIGLLIDNQIFLDDLQNSKNIDPIHLNDIEPVLNNSNYWKKGDLFLSIRSQNSIVHYRPRTNKVINYITGPFKLQHDVDVISDKEISIFNNNGFNPNNYSEVIIYNFETKSFTKLFNDQLKKNNFKTISQGLSHIFNDGSLMVEEQNHGRIILFNNKGEKEWEFINKDKNGDIGFISWSRVIEDELFIEKFKSIIKNKKCLN